MPKHDYTKHANRDNRHNTQNKQQKNEEFVKIAEPKVEVPAVEMVKPFETVARMTTPVTRKNPIGKVVGCLKLNVREQASTYSDVVCEISVNTNVMIDDDNSTNEFYKICTEFGIEGYCMKKFIEVEK